MLTDLVQVCRREELVAGEEYLSPRLRVRRVHIEDVALEAAKKSILRGRAVSVVQYGGSVCNSYGYRAETEGVLAVAHQGVALVWLNRLGANKVSFAGVVGKAVEALRPLYDERYGPGKTEAARSLLQPTWEDNNSQVWLSLVLERGLMNLFYEKAGAPVIYDYLEDHDILPPADMNREPLLDWLVTASAR